MAMTEVVDEAVTDLEPLYSVVDPDSLDHLFGPTATNPGRIHGTVEFEYADHHVVVNASGKGHIYEQEARGQPSASRSVGAIADDA